MFQLFWKLSAVVVPAVAWYRVMVRAEATEAVAKTTAAIKRLKYLFITYPFVVNDRNGALQENSKDHDLYAAVQLDTQCARQSARTAAGLGPSN